jgi:hypothetical protein
MAGQPPIRPEFSTLAIAELHKRGRVHQRGGILVLWYGNQTPRARRRPWSLIPIPEDKINKVCL